MGYISKISAAFVSCYVNAIIETLPWDPTFEPARAEAGCYGKGVNAQFLREEKKMLLKEFHVAETISGAGPSRALWYSISENRRLRRKRHESLIDSAIERVSTRLRLLGHDVQQVFVTKPSIEGATITASKGRE
jgi:hypothetical protein